MAKYLAEFTKRKGPISTRQLREVRKWLEDDWESHDIDRDATKLIWRLVETIEGMAGSHPTMTRPEQV